MKYTFKNIENLDCSEVDEMKECTFLNIDTINSLSNELERLRLANPDIIESNDSINESAYQNNFVEEKEDTNNLLEEIKYYYQRIKKIDLKDNEESLEKLKHELPIKRKSNYKDIIIGINILLMKDINEIREFIENEKSILSKEDLEDFKRDILDIQRKISTIFKISNDNNLESKIDKLEEETLNNIIFLETDFGNIYALNDLDNNRVPTEYYQDFYNLIRSIEDGTFKRVKKFTDLPYGIAEVRSSDTRVIFDRIGPNIYIIIGALIKKVKLDRAYMEFLKTRVLTYRDKRDEIVNLICEEYLDLQREHLDKIYRLLKQDTRKKR